MKKTQFRVEYFFLIIACIVLTTVFFFKTKAERSFIQRQIILSQSEQNVLLGISKVPDLSSSYKSYTYFDSSLDEQLKALYSLSPLISHNGTYSVSAARIVALFSVFSTKIATIEKRLRFGYDSLIILSLVLIALSVIILIINNAEQQKEINSFSIRQDEQQSISRELHDGALQELAALRISLQTGSTEESLSHTDRTVREIRQICGLLRFDLTEPFDTIVTNQSLLFEKTYSIPVTIFCASHFVKLFPQYLKLELLRILEEALSNVGRHAQAHNVQVRLIDSGELFLMIISDDGIGIKIDDNMNNGTAIRVTGAFSRDQDCHIGIKSIRERVQRIGGTVEWKTNLGTTLTVTIKGTD